MLFPARLIPHRLRRVSGMAVLLVGGAGISGLQAQADPCFDRAGRRVPVVESDSLPFAAWATLRNSGEPVIFWNPARLTNASSPIRLLVFLHECGHHILGHVHKRPSIEVKRGFEIEADCWAIQRMVEGEMISALTLDTALEEIRRWTGDRTHLGGEALALVFRRCLYDKVNQNLWFRFLDALTNASPDSLAAIRGDVIAESGDERIRESNLDAPGTFDCEIRGGHVLLCKLFQGVRHERVIRRYREIKGIIERWAGSEWRFLEREQPAFHQPVLFLAWNERSGSNLALVVTDRNQLFFTWSAIRPEPTPRFP